MAAKSKVQAGEMMQLTETGIPAWKMLADQIGVSVPEAMSMVSKGAIDAATGITALVSGMEQSFGGMMDQQSQTISGTWSTLMDGLEQSAAQVGLQIAESLNLTGIFQSLGDMLTNFAATVQSSGLTEALLTAIPPEFQAGILLIVSTDWSCHSGHWTFCGQGSPDGRSFCGGSCCCSSFYCGCGSGGHSPLCHLEKRDDRGRCAGGHGDSDGNGHPGCGCRSGNDQCGSPVHHCQSSGAGTGVHFGGCGDGSGFLCIPADHRRVVNGVLNFISVLSECVTWILNAFTYLVEGIGACIDEVGSILSDMAGSILPSWASSSLSTIANFVSEAISWLSSLIQKILETNNALGSMGGEGGGDGGGGGSVPAKREFKLPDFSNLRGGGGDIPVPSGGGGGGGSGGGGVGGGSSGGVDQLASAAAQTSKSIEEEWFRTFQTKSAWWTDGIRKKQTNWKSPNPPTRTTNGTRPVWRNSMPRSAWTPFRRTDQSPGTDEQGPDLSFDAVTAKLTLYGSKQEQEVMKMQSDMEKAVSSIDDKYAKLSQDFISLTSTEKAVFLNALKEKGISYEQASANEIAFDKQANLEKAAAYKSYMEERNAYFAQGKDIQAALDEAYNQNSLALLQETLTAEMALRQSNIDAEKSLMDTYQEAYMNAHMGTLELIADMASTTLSGLETAFTDILTGAKNAKDAFLDLERPC